MDDEHNTMPSLADTITAIRRELAAAQEAGKGLPVKFRTGPVELEFEVVVTRSGGGHAGVQLWVVSLGGKGELDHATTQRIKVTLEPMDEWGHPWNLERSGNKLRPGEEQLP